MSDKKPDEGVRALSLSAVLVSVAVAAAILWLPHEREPGAAVAMAGAFPPSAVPTVRAGAATATKSATPISCARMTRIVDAAPMNRTATVALATAAATLTATTTPTASSTVTSSPVPTATHTVTPTRTKAMFTLRDDLPPLSLRDWPRPANDNGWGMHFLVNAYPSEEEIDLNIRRMVDLRMKWAVVLYGDELQLQKLAPRFRDAGIMAVWRPMIRPYERYYEWGRDIRILQQLGVQPYMQIYNEPSVSQEWPDRPIDQALFLENLVSACEDVYNAGGFVGLQFASESWLVDALREIKSRNGEALFGRMFFVPHSYGMNHPPNYEEDINTVLSFGIFAQIFQQEIGMVPPMIVGEGGWKYGATDDARFPKVSDELHRDYYVELYNWFRTGILSNGEPLPDYLFAFCPWLIAHKMDDNAFYDSFAGDRVMTIEAIKAIPPFVRRFSWDQ